MTSYICQEPIELYNAKNEPHINYGLGLIILLQYWLIDYKRETSLIRDINNGRNYAGEREWGYGNPLHFLGNFPVN